jgi:hypothetical protein
MNVPARCFRQITKSGVRAQGKGSSCRAGIASVRSTHLTRVTDGAA